MNTQGTVKEKAEAEDGFVITVDIPSFKSQYPTKLNRVPAEEAQGMIVGQTYLFDLERGNPKKGKTAESTTAWDFWYNYKGFSSLAPHSTETASVAESTPNRVTQGDERGQSIERQTALKVAGELYSALCKSPQGEDDWGLVREETLALARRLVVYFFQEDEQRHPLA